MIKIKQCDALSLNKKFSVFSTNTIRGTHKDTNYVVSQLKMYEKQYKKLGIVDTFCERASEFANKLAEKELYDFAGMIFGNLVKIESISVKQREMYAQKALEISKLHGDPIHIIARQVDLKKIYKSSGTKKQYLDTAFELERTLISVIDDFEVAKSRFRTIKRSPNSLHTYKLQLANIRVDIGKGLLKTHPAASKRKILGAKKIFEEYKKENEIQFCNMLLSQIAL